MKLFEMCKGDCYEAKGYSLVIYFNPDDDRGKDLRKVLDAFKSIGLNHCDTFKTFKESQEQ